VTAVIVVRLPSVLSLIYPKPAVVQAPQIALRDRGPVLDAQVEELDADAALVVLDAAIDGGPPRADRPPETAGA
jgi:hypothetical protein